MRLRGSSNVWAIGDCALVINDLDHKPAPTTAQFAVREAQVLASNLLAMLAGQPTRAFSHRSRGAMAAIGHRKGVADLFGIPLSGLPAWLLWRAYYLAQMPTLGRKLRIFVEWTWGMFFPNDITHLRFSRSHDLDGDAVESPEPAVSVRAPAAVA
jgi:NADH dehydrogenase